MRQLMDIANWYTNGEENDKIRKGEPREQPIAQKGQNNQNRQNGKNKRHQSDAEVLSVEWRWSLQSAKERKAPGKRKNGSYGKGQSLTIFWTSLVAFTSMMSLAQLSIHSDSAGL